MKGYRTIALNVLATVVGALMATDWAGVTDARTAGLVVGGLGDNTYDMSRVAAVTRSTRMPGSARDSSGNATNMPWQ